MLVASSYAAQPRANGDIQGGLVWWVPNLVQALSPYPLGRPIFGKGIDMLCPAYEQRWEYDALQPIQPFNLETAVTCRRG
jgi:hypothetical protein